MTNTKTETFTLVSSNSHWNTRTGTTVIFTVGQEGVIVQYYPNGTADIPDGFCEVILEGEPTIARIYEDDCLSRERAKKVWNRFLELGFKRV
jgi:hypothetical protein